MVELRFNAIRPNGQILSGTLSAENYSEGKKKVNLLIAKEKLKLKSVEKKSTYIYKIKKGNEPAIKGEQRALSKD